MEYIMILNAVSVIACSAAIATACKVTAWPLLAFILIPKWGYRHFDDKEEKDEPEKDRTS